MVLSYLLIVHLRRQIRNSIGSEYTFRRIPNAEANILYLKSNVEPFPPICSQDSFSYMLQEGRLPSTPLWSHGSLSVIQPDLLL
ncbi:hypothetical protein TNCT_309781 [Trichonephila clavata]|uniref:Uncharacterized protein n=1 Tax=Trichonephila clavata TaxID=2740835 RepID=A0A8X6KXL6_TRICU|nr:hypothetical protein TNCT_309781 [Trichonephila clavata]